YVDGTPRARTDPSGSATLSLDPNVYEVRVAKNGFEPQAPRKIRIATETQQAVTFPMTLQTAHLELTGAPANLELRVDGQLLGRTDGSPVFRFPAPVKPGDRTVEISQGLLQPAQGSVSRSVTQRFDPGE